MKRQREDTKMQLNVVSENFKSLRDIALETIRNAIISGHFQPGEHLKERELAKEMGISTTPIKEAFRILSHEGLVETLPRKGTYVSEMVNSSIEETLMLKAYLEGLTARLAAVKITDQELEQLKHQIDVMEQLKNEQEIERYSEENTNFHMMIRRIAKSPILSKTLLTVENVDKAFRKRALQLSTEIQQGFIEHQQIFEAIKLRDADLAETRMKQHILRTAQHVLQQSKD
ncbi:GntR family transcriptional regulator [Brevibacillus humidisoli]|uniref:GntR family transcriptional regulator n=1 Tax=Brevibacillus humidisoli TaxID=2895522 RepID=UPI001E5351C7|nr:GntR family transcriptional regulator [Brevibacillus humidisoli]UFJ43105.1 GntR family transcriptional regulator [Brevibacillus humidisoli]